MAAEPTTRSWFFRAALDVCATDDQAVTMVKHVDGVLTSEHRNRTEITAYVTASTIQDAISAARALVAAGMTSAGLTATVIALDVKTEQDHEAELVDALGPTTAAEIL